jgi:hypothetical protein
MPTGIQTCVFFAALSLVCLYCVVTRYRAQLASFRGGLARYREELASCREVLAHYREELARRCELLSCLRTHRLISVKALKRAQRSVFMLSHASKGDPVGVAVFFERGRAVTAANNLRGSSSGYVYGAFGRDAERAAPPEFRLRVVLRDEALDVAVLVCDSAYVHQHYLTPYRGPLNSLAGETMVLAAFQLGLVRAVPHMFDASLGVMPASAVRISATKRHLAYSSSIFDGDCGGALLLYNGQLVGIHVVLVSALREVLQRKLVIEERLSSVDESLNALIRGMSDGCVAVLASQFTA